ncbi:MAG: hypothetical protein P1U56_26495, partial [Saprospiraceae bacterium]|nr:hypothetical protein [Saprospiraceae bacterium]
DSRTKDIELGMTNAKHEIKLNIGYQCKLLIDLGTGKVKAKCVPKSPSDPPAPSGGSNASIEIKFKGGIGMGVVHKEADPDDPTSVAKTNFALATKLGAGLKAKIPLVSPAYVLLGLDVGVGWKILPESKVKFEVRAYAGVGVAGKIGPFKADAFLAGGIVYKWDDGKSALLWLVLLEAGIDLKVASVSISAELQGYILGGTGVASGRVAINVSIFLVINISASYDCTKTKKI